MSLKVVGAGFGRTGTLSLKFALEKLGYDKCYHMMEVGNHDDHFKQWLELSRGGEMDWVTLFEGYQASVDWPSCNWWREQLAAFPDAKVILSRRDPQKWYTSVMNTIYQVSVGNRAKAEKEGDAQAKAAAQWAFEVIWGRVFDDRMDDKEHVIACYEAHNQAVIDEVPADALLVYEPGDGWAPLCEFLDVPIPDEDYPRVNSTEEFKERWEKIDEEARQRKESQ